VLRAVGEQALQGLHVARQLSLGEVLLEPGVADSSSLNTGTVDTDPVFFFEFFIRIWLPSLRMHFYRKKIKIVLIFFLRD
jgi:hypothetical protein